MILEPSNEAESSIPKGCAENSSGLNFSYSPSLSLRKGICL